VPETANRYEAERSAWIKSRTWLDKPAAARRAEQLAALARKRDRTEAGLDETSMHEGRTKGVLHRWTDHEDTKTSALGFIAFLIVYVIVIPVFFGLAWLVSKAAYALADARAGRTPVRIWPYPLIAAGLGALFYFGRPAGLDLGAIHVLARLLEEVSGGALGPAVLSRWFAAGWVSWMEIQVVLGFLHAAWTAYAWGWAAPAVRRGGRGASTTDKGMKIISGLGTGQKPSKGGDGDDAMKIISGPAVDAPEPSAPEPEPLWDDDEDDIEWAADAAAEGEEGAER
jgi:hypothetical protein